jgi:membrane protein required for colicin V production
MHPIDIGLAVFLALGAWQGYKQGIVLLLVNSLAWIAVIVLAFRFLDVISSWLQNYVKAGSFLLPLLSFILVVLVAGFGIRWMGNAIRQAIKKTLLGPLDEAGGAFLGLLRAGFVLSSLLMGLKIMGVQTHLPPQSELWLYPVVEKLGPMGLKLLAPLLPFLQELLRKV